MHFQKLRNEEHAQVEIRKIAYNMLFEVDKLGVFEHSLNAFGWTKQKIYAGI